MKKIICFVFVAFIGLLNVTAQDVYSTQSNLKAYVEDLSAKLSKLQHDYDYLYCSHEINLIELELKDLINNIDMRSNAILINCYHSRFNIDLYTAYRDNYNASLELMDTMKERVDGIQAAVALKTLTSNFTDKEIELLMKCSKFLDNCLSKLQGSLDYYKLVIGIYKDMR